MNGPVARRAAWSVVASCVAVTGLLARVSPARGAVTSAGAATTLSCATSLVNSWSVDQLAHEVVAVSMDAAHAGALAPAARAGYGAYLLFGASAPAQLGGVVSALQRERHDGVTTLVMTDAEGGGVERMTNLLAPIPWAQVMGRRLSVGQIQAEGRRLGVSLRGAGVNVDLAPVADLDGRAIYPGPLDADGLRSFGAQSARVGADVTAFERGLESAGVLGTLKHFPGLGGATRNTDYGPAATPSWRVERRRALVPFRQALQRTHALVMVANASIPGFTSLPASLSPRVMTYLRSSMNYRGLIMTDSLGAGAIGALGLSAASAGVAAIAAGADLVLAGSPATPAAALATAGAMSGALSRSVASGALAEATLASAAAQVVAVEGLASCPATPPL